MGPTVLGEAFAPVSRVSFAPASATATFSVEVLTSEGPRTCVAPCTLELPVGRHVARVRGTKEFAQAIDVPAHGGDFEIEYAQTKNLKPIAAGMLLGGGAALALGIYGMRSNNAILAGVGIGAGGPAVLAGAILMFVPARAGTDRIAPKDAPATARREGTMELVGAGISPTEAGVIGGAWFRF